MSWKRAECLKNACHVKQNSVEPHYFLNFWWLDSYLGSFNIVPELIWRLYN